MKKTIKWQQKYKQQLTGVFAIAVVGMLIGGIVLAKGNPSRTGTGAKIYLSPSTGSYAIGSTIAAAVRENSGTKGVYSVQTGLSYPQNLLQYVSTDSTGSGFVVDTGLSTGGGGHVEIIRGSTTPISGDQLISTVNFKVLASGSAAVSFDALCQGSSVTNCTTVYDVNTSNVISTIVNGSFRLGSTKH